MSRETDSWCWDHSAATGNDLLVLLAISNNANEETGESWPSLATIARRARCSERTVQRCLERLAAAGELTVGKQAGGGATWTGNPRHRPNCYTLPGYLMGGQIDVPDDGATGGATPTEDDEAAADQGGQSDIPGGVTGGATGGATETSDGPTNDDGWGDKTGPDGVTLLSHEPKEEPDQNLKENPPTPLTGGAAVEAVFTAWKEATGKTDATVLSEVRRKKIVWALANYPTDDVLDAVRGWQNSAHNRGENERGTPFNDIELLLRDAAHIEKFRDLERHPPEGRHFRPETARAAAEREAINPDGLASARFAAALAIANGSGVASDVEVSASLARNGSHVLDVPSTPKGDDDDDDLWS